MTRSLFFPKCPAKKIFLIFTYVLVSTFFCSASTKLNPAETNHPISSREMHGARQSGPPNIIIFLGDDIGYEIPGTDGGESYNTPNTDLMAQSGMRFTHCYAAPTCSPSRFMLLTGKYNFRNY